MAINAHSSKIWVGLCKVQRRPSRIYWRRRTFTTSAKAALEPYHNPRVEDAHIQRELFIDVLNVNVTKRDARQYLASFKPPKAAVGPEPEATDAQFDKPHHSQEALPGVNLGVLFDPSPKTVNVSEVFQATHLPKQTEISTEEPLQLALVCFKQPASVDDVTLDGLATTLSQLVMLGMRIVVVLDCNVPGPVSPNQVDHGHDVQNIRTQSTAQAERLSRAIERRGPQGARVVTDALQWAETTTAAGDSGVTSPINMAIPALLLGPLKRGIIPVVPSMAYTSHGQLQPASSADVMVGMSRQLTATISQSKNGDTAPTGPGVDRLIVIDPVGGIPSKTQDRLSHVFINLEQEFETIHQALLDASTEAATSEPGAHKAKEYDQHRTNLAMIRNCLKCLPSTSSALIMTPHAGANSPETSVPPSGTSAVMTRPARQKNILIHNLLTNRPIVSSSLPAERLPSRASRECSGAPAATLIKRGMPLIMVPSTEDRCTGWQSPATGRDTLDLENDARIDFGRLVHLIENSFRRRLDVDDYLSRTKNRVAGLIVAGDYEGAAVFTWEMPPHTTDPTRLVPYLDKFAVLQSSQGSSGVADILFQAMVRTCFPYGVCWRSRKNNPVNKWYFDRAAGSWQIPGTEWTMFWTGRGVVADKRKWGDYVAVCESVKPSWRNHVK